MKQEFEGFVFDFNDSNIETARAILEKIGMKKDYIGFLRGRPERFTAINQEDCLNLKINLNATKSVDEFLAIA